MSDDPEVAHELAVSRHMMRRSDRFARRLGLDEATKREIIKKVVFEMPLVEEEERLIDARARMIIASV